ncbi:MAG: hypothetical protein AAB893_01120 [Patescibacteria group bacterium]
MKVFFTASQRGKKEFGKYYQRIYDQLELLGYSHLETSLLKISSKEFYDKLENTGHAQYTEYYNNNMKRIQEADICVFESSLHSLSIGFMIQKSLDNNKPTIVLYFEDNIPHFLHGMSEDKLILAKYTGTDLEEVLKKTLGEATDLREKRFNFFISPALLTYLEGASKKLGITKSTFIRNLIQDHRRKNK